MLNRNRYMLTYVVFSSGRTAIGRDRPPVVGRRGWFAVGIFSAPPAPLAARFLQQCCASPRIFKSPVLVNWDNGIRLLEGRR